MYEKDPVLEMERMIKSIHDKFGDKTKPVLNRYPLLFAFLVTFGLASVLHGFELVTDEISFFKENPYYLLIIGVIVLLLTGTLYKKLDKAD